MVPVGPLYVGGTVLLSLFLLRVYMRHRWGRCRSRRTLAGKTAIITGANSGLGKATACELARRKARVILACRDLESARKAVLDIRRETLNGELVVKRLDLASLASVRSFAQEILDTEPALHLLINNAGVYQCPFGLTEDGFEMQFAVNHLGHFLLADLLLHLLVSSAPSRVIVVSSQLHQLGIIDFDNLNAEAGYDQKAAYRNGKLANVLFGRELAKRVLGTGVEVLIISPGFVWTGLGRHVQLHFWEKLVLMLFGVVLVRTPSEGCQTIVHCAVSEEVEGRNGVYYRNCREAPFYPVALDDRVGARLWDISKKMTALPQ